MKSRSEYIKNAYIMLLGAQKRSLLSLLTNLPSKNLLDLHWLYPEHALRTDDSR